MFLTLSFFSSIMLILTFIFILLTFFSKHKFLDREKASPFECGFDPFINSRISFSIHFFTIMLMFLIFDIEISVMIPLPIIKNFTFFMVWSLSILMICIILILGLYIEWKEGSMIWK